eukprot:jgi/Picre1/28903/NNA_004299.t1
MNPQLAMRQNFSPMNPTQVMPPQQAAMPQGLTPHIPSHGGDSRQDFCHRTVVETSVPEESLQDAGVPLAGEVTLLAWMLDLTRTHMKSMYEACPGWGWDDTGKRAEFEHQDARFLVVFDMKKNETPVAFAHIRFEVEEGLPILYVYELQVCTSSQGCGLGTWLMQHVQAIAKDRKLTRIMLTVFAQTQTL